METRTSLTQPLEISVVEPTAGGRIGITICPGRRGDSALGYRWERDLGVDLDAIAAWGPGDVVTLIEDHEAVRLGVEALGDGVRARGIAWHHLPIVDLCPPGPTFERAWRDLSPRLCDRLRGGQAVLVHCRAGLGRSGTVAAMLLMDLGADGPDAMSRVRAARPGAIETASQVDYVLAYRATAERRR
jgi:protein-tyrosine phosphatase